MTTKRTGIERRLQIAGMLIVVGMLVELISLLWSHPVAFLIFIMVGGVFIIAGVGYYLTSLILPERSS